MRAPGRPLVLSISLVALLCVPVLAGGGPGPSITVVDEPDPFGMAVQIDVGDYGTVFSALKITGGVDPIPQVMTITDGADPILEIETTTQIIEGPDPIPTIVATIVDGPDPFATLRIVYTIQKPGLGGK